MKKTNWFVKIQQEEMEKCETPFQIAVFLAIKSFTANGKLEVPLSYREISKRSKCSIGHLKEVIEQLEKIKLVFTVGTLKRLGGTTKVFTVGTLNENDFTFDESVHSENTSNESVHTPNTLSTESVHRPNESVHRPNESVHRPNTKMRLNEPRQLNNIITEEKNLEKIFLTRLQIWGVAIKNKCPLKDVTQKYLDVIDLDNRKKYDIKNTLQTLGVWVRRDIQKGYIETIKDPEGIEMLNFEKPRPEVENLLVKEI